MNMNLSQFTMIDISDLPKNASKEMLDFYQFLLSKHAHNKRSEKDDIKASFIKSVEKQKFHLP